MGWFARLPVDGSLPLGHRQHAVTTCAQACFWDQCSLCYLSGDDAAHHQEWWRGSDSGEGGDTYWDCDGSGIG